MEYMLGKKHGQTENDADDCRRNRSQRRRKPNIVARRFHQRSASENEQERWQEGEEGRYAGSCDTSKQQTVRSK